MNFKIEDSAVQERMMWIAEETNRENAIVYNTEELFGIAVKTLKAELNSMPLVVLHSVKNVEALFKPQIDHPAGEGKCCYLFTGSDGMLAVGYVKQDDFQSLLSKFKFVSWPRNKYLVPRLFTSDENF